MNNTIKVTCVALGIIMVLSGCESAPVRNADNTIEEELFKNTTKMVSVDDAKKEVEELKGKSFYGFTFSDTFDINEINSVSKIGLKQFNNDENKVKEALVNIWDGYEKNDWSNIELSEYPNPEMPEYKAYAQIDENNSIAYSYDNQGFFMGDSLVTGLPMMNEAKKVYDFQCTDVIDNCKDEVFDLEDGKISIGDAKSFVEERINSCLTLEDNISYKVQKIFVTEGMEENTYQMSFIVGRTFDNGDLLTQSNFTFGSEGHFYDVTHSGMYIRLVMKKTSEIDYINLGVSLLNIDSVNKEEKIISPKWAVNEMNKIIAHKSGTNFSYCDLVYIVTQENSKAPEKKQGIVSIDDIDKYSTEIRPFWIFACPDAGGYANVFGESILVDALSGDIYYYETTSLY